MTAAVNYTGLAPQSAPFLQTLPRTQADWQLVLNQLNVMQQMLFTLAAQAQAGVSGTIVTAKLTTANGSMVFSNGTLVTNTPAT